MTYSQGSPVAQYTAMAVTDPAGLTYREWATLVTSGWLATQTTQKQIEGALGSFNVIPADVTGFTAKAGRDSIVLTWTAVTGSPVRAAADGYLLQRSTDGGETWYDVDGILEGNSRVPSNFFSWTFDRTLDGYPEIFSSRSFGYPGLDAFRFRIRAISMTGRPSFNWTVLDMVDTSEYGTWLPEEPEGVAGSSADRTVKVDWNDSSVYGLIRYELQIALPSADPSWYEPALALDPMESEDNYRQSIVVGNTRQVTISQFTHAVPLAGQNEDPPNPHDTAYSYRVRAVSARRWVGVEPAGFEQTSDGYTAGPWSVSIPVLARATGAYDLVQHAIGEAQIAFGAIHSEHMSAQNLAAVFAYIAALSGGVEDEYNTWILNDYPDRVKPIGYFRIGAANVGVEYNPATGKLRIIGVNMELTESDLTTYEPDADDPKRQTIEGLGITIRDDDSHGNAELVRLEYKGDVGLWGGEKLGGMVHHVDDEGLEHPQLERSGGGIIKKETDSYGPKYTLFDGTVLRPSPLYYIQFPGHPDPGSIYGGLWENISTQFPGDFFRVEGGYALAFNGGRQDSSNKLHNHGGATGWMDRNNPHSHSGTGTYSTGAGDTPRLGSPYSWFGYISATDINHLHAISAEGAEEARSQNQTIRVWERKG